MNADKAEQGLEPEVRLHSEITGVIIGAAQRVHNTLGHGFLEKVYENALAIELRAAGFVVEQGLDIVVRYNGRVVGAYEADSVRGAKGNRRDQGDFDDHRRSRGSTSELSPSYGS